MLLDSGAESGELGEPEERRSLWRGLGRRNATWWS
jgi:hypothetical protein